MTESYRENDHRFPYPFYAQPLTYSNIAPYGFAGRDLNVLHTISDFQPGPGSYHLLLASPTAKSVRRTALTSPMGFSCSFLAKTAKATVTIETYIFQIRTILGPSSNGEVIFARISENHYSIHHRHSHRPRSGAGIFTCFQSYHSSEKPRIFCLHFHQKWQPYSIPSIL